MIKGALAIFTRDFRKFLSNPVVIVMTLFMPIMYLIIFGNAMGGTISNIPIAVVQEEPCTSNTILFVSAVEGLQNLAQRDYPRTFEVTVYTDEQKAKRDLPERRCQGSRDLPVTHFPRWCCPPVRGQF